MQRVDFLEGVRINEPSTITGLVYTETDFANPDVQARVEAGQIMVTLGSPEGFGVDVDKVSGLVESIAIENGRVKVGWRLIESNAGALVRTMIEEGFTLAVRPSGYGLVSDDCVEDYMLRAMWLGPPATGARAS